MSKESHTIRIEKSLYHEVMLVAAQRTLDTKQQVTVRDVIEGFIREALQLPGQTGD